MDGIFILKLALSFVGGGGWIVVITSTAEKFGTRLGGVFAGAPSNMVIALFFIGWTQTPLVASEATTIIPAVMAINVLFLMVYILLSRYNFYVALTGGLVFWFALVLGIILLGFWDFGSSLVVFVVLLVASYYLIEKKTGIRSVARVDSPASGIHLVFRGIASGTIIALAVFTGKIGGPIIDGAFAAFAAVYLSVLLVTHFARGKAFSLATMKVVMLGGINNVLYAVAVRYTYPHLGLVSGTLLSYLAALIGTFCLYIYVRKKVS